MKAYYTMIGHEDKIYEKEVKSIDRVSVVFQDGSSCACHRTKSPFHYWKTEEDAKAACLLMAQVKKETLAFYANTMEDIMKSMDGINIDNIQLVLKG